MPANDYHFITRWRLEATAEEVGALLGDGPGLSRWWPAVYVAVRELDPGDRHGRGKRLELHTKGWLPYTLRWQAHITDVRADQVTLEAEGDFSGRGIWSFAQDGPQLNISYDWRIMANKPLLRWLSPILKPIFAANHRWAMAQGEISLRRELARRRARSAAERARIPPPPPATRFAAAPFAAGLILAGLAAAWLLRAAPKLAITPSPGA